MVGEGVLHECLRDPDVEQVLVINRQPGGVTHPKLTELIHADFFNLAPVEAQLTGYNAFFFCLGVSSVGMKENEYYRLTYSLTLHVARTLHRLNPTLTFCYVSGAGTDGTERGSNMWARVKGKTENELLQLGFRSAYMFRPGYLHPTKGLKNTKSYYAVLSWLYPLGRLLFGRYVCTLAELGRAMIHSVRQGYGKSVLEVGDIVRLANS